MSGLAEQELDQSPTTLWFKRAGLLVSVLGVLGALGWLLSGAGQHGAASGTKRQTVSIKVLPDTPPPPPPKQEERPQPKQEPKQTMQMDAPKQVQAPVEAPPQLKMEGAAGDGPSAFGAGSISKDYQGGAVGTGDGGGTGTQSSRAQFRFFINTARQQLKDELERQLKTDESVIVADFSIWLTASGEIQRYDIQSTGKPAVDGQVKAALAQTAHALKLVPPPGLPLPVKFRLSLKPIG